MRLITGENSAGTGSLVSGTGATPRPWRIWMSPPRGSRCRLANRGTGCVQVAWWRGLPGPVAVTAWRRWRG